MIRTPTLMLASAAALFAVAARAQDDNSPPRNPDIVERYNQVIVYGDDPCPAGENGDIVVCARMGEDERYRIPPDLRGSPNDIARESWTARVTAIERTGRFGTDSCSPVGLGGFTGCLSQTINNAYAERAQAAGTDWSRAMADERQRRMDGFDAASQEVEAQIAIDEAARVAREQAAEDEAIAAEAGPLPAPQPRAGGLTPATPPPPAPQSPN
jgi:hypothetical protein